MEALVKRKGVIKGQLTKISNFVNTKGENANYDELSIRLSKVNEMYNQFVAVEDQIFNLDADSNSDMDIFDEAYYSIVAKIQVLIRQLSTKSAIPNNPRDDADASLNTTQINFRSDFKLPRLNLPTFDGNLKQWQSFYDIYLSTVHENTNLSSAQKFKYLLGQLRGAAYTTVCHFRVDDASYFEALKRLVKKYDRKRTIVESYIREFLLSPKFSKPSAVNITKLHDTLDETIRGLKALGDPATHRDPWLILLAAEKLDDDTRQLWKYESAETDYPTIDEFLEFLSKRMNSLAEPTTKRFTTPKSPTPMNSYYTNTTIPLPPCPLCENEAHRLYECPKFRAMDIGTRREFISKSNRCFNCLTDRHPITSCKSRRHCQKCSKRHNTLLHYIHTPQITEGSKNNNGSPNTYVNVNQNTVQPTSSNNNESATALLAVPMCRYPAKPVPIKDSVEDTSSIKGNIPILPTAKLDIQDKYGNWTKCRALLDSGSTHNFITEGLISRLKIPRSKSDITISSINQSRSCISRGKSGIKLRSSINPSFCLNVEAYILPSISTRLPHESFDKTLLKFEADKPLADPEYYIAADVELLLGCETFFEILLDGKFQPKPDYPYVQNSKLGWLVGGIISDIEQPVSNTSKTCFHVDSETLQRLEVAIERFWRTEEVLSPKTLTTEERNCVKFFNATTKLDEAGIQNKIVVQLPFKDDPPGIGESFTQALRRYQNLERRLVRDEDMRKPYVNFMQEYLKLNHMELIPDDEILKPNNQICYLPHHPVVKNSSSTTKVRVVFDASAKFSNGYSLNDNLMVGPTVQDNLVNLLIRFRKHRYIFSADIEKMFRQISISDQDKDYHRILWRENPNMKLSQYRLKTVTYGTSPAPFLATASLHYLADKYEKIYPEASKVIKADFYMDDLLSGSHSLDSAIRLQSDIIQLLNCGGFNIRKWSANHPSLLENIPSESREMSAWELTDNKQIISILGIKYNALEDYFSFKVSLPVAQPKITKRLYLSETSRIYDPLGLLSPVTIGFKILFQSLWLEGIGWDEELPSNILDNYLLIREQLEVLTHMRFPRWIFTMDEVELHGFSDASRDAYAAIIYSRIISPNGAVKTNLVIAKTRVAPIKTLTIPKLELNGATLLVRLLKLVEDSLKLSKRASIHLYTDSTIVLQWLSKPPKTLQTFQANRVAEIMSYTNPTQWHFVPSHENPADKATRGVTPKLFVTDNLWIRGPNFLNENPLVYPASPIRENDDSIPVISNLVSIPQAFEVIEKLCRRYSNIRTLTRVLAYILRFKKILQTRKINRNFSKLLTVEEVVNAEYCLFRFVQHECFKNDISLLLNHKLLPIKSKIFYFYPYIDNYGLLRMRGRLENAAISHDAKHPIILPNNHIITESIIRDMHYRNLHASHKLVHTLLKQRFAIPRARNVIRRIIHLCITCRRFNPKSEQQLMGQLPGCRVNPPARPFIEVGIDLAGPFNLKPYRSKGAKSYKAYLVIFVCMATKATTIEIVSDMSTELFISSLKRFSAIRGLPQHIYCDNGTNLVGARRELQQLYTQFREEAKQIRVEEWCRDNHIQWHFIPPATPNFGGLWEAAVKSCKYHLRRVMKNVLLTYEEFLTIIRQVEALLNSRPLGDLPEDEWNPLTPAHFLITQPLTMLPEPSLQPVRVSYLNRWQLIQQMMQGFWKQWSQEYLTSLNKFYKWYKENHQFIRGDLVLLRDPKLPPAKWPIARIAEVHPGHDKLTRIVSLRLPGGRILKRPVEIIAVSWEEWWTYDGISGPAFWGLINPEWSLCNRGRRQSPVNLEPQRLLFDPNLRPLHIDKHRISGVISNTGHSVIFTVDNETVIQYGTSPQISVNLTGGPLSYKYRFQEIHVHYGLHDQFGSEHSVEGYTFPAEIQLFGYNSQLYSNFSDALNRAQGIVGVSVLLQLGDLSNAELRMLTDQLEKIRYGGDEAPVRRISIRGLLPETDHYMTYEGSTTAPACHETVTWIVLNKPIYITKQQMHALRRLMQGSPDHPKAPLGNNFRPPQQLYHRPVRTNIDFRGKQNGKICPTMYRDVHYKANSWKQH